MAITFPSNPNTNDTHTVNGRTWVWDGATWKLSGTINNGISLEVSDTAPATPIEGDMWYDSSTGSTFTYYDSVWVELGNTASVVSFIADADGDTRVHVEESADDDTIRFDTAGTERLTITSAGHVLPSADVTYDLGSASYRFRDLYLSGSSIDLGGVQITSDGTSLSMPPISSVAGDFTVDTGTLHVDSTNNRLGIGTTSPVSSLEVHTDFPKLTLTNDGQLVSANAYFAGIEMRDSSENLAGAVGFISGEDQDMRITSYRTGADLHLVTGGANNERVTVTDGGNVGIGTTLPDYPLDVNGKAIVGAGDNQTPDAFGNGHLMIAGAGYTGFASLDGTAMWVGHNSASRNLNFAVDETARMTLDTSGRLGIGTTSPSKPLHIVYDDPTIQLTDTNTNADSIISANSSVGSLILGADENNEVGSSQIAFKVDGTTLMGLQANGNLEMLGGTVKGDGALVQMVAGYSGASDLTSSANIASITMSPKYSDSTMLVFVNYHVYKYNTTQAVNNQYQLYQSGGGNITALHNYVVYDSPSYMFQGVVSGTIAAGSTASRTYHFYVTASSSADRIYFYWKRMYVLEIAT